MSTRFTIPVELVGEVRVGLHDVLGDAAQAITGIVERPDRERHPKRYTAPRRQLTGAFALLDLIGWRQLGRPAAVKLDLDEHHRALGEAVQVMLSVARTDLEEADLVDGERAQHGQPPKREETIARVRRLSELVETIAAARTR